MEVLNQLALVGLRNYCSPLHHTFTIPYTNDELQSLHIIDNNRSRYPILSSVIIQSLKSSSALVILLDLDYSWNSNNKFYKNIKKKVNDVEFSRLKIVKDIDSITDLMIILKNLRDPSYFNDKLDTTNPVLGLIIIDNISIFHWPMVLKQHYPMEFNSFFQISRTLQNYFNCGLITTSMGNFFESGLSNSYDNPSSAIFNSSNTPNLLKSTIIQGKVKAEYITI